MNTTATSANGIDDLIKFYLQARGYQKALEALEQETTGNNNHLVTQPSSSSLITTDSTTAMEVIDVTHVDHKGGNGVIKEKNIEKLLLNAAESLCFLGVKQGDVLSYRKEYDVIHSWMNQSLDTIRPYLQAINFALFVYCYIGLIRFGEPVIANEFWNIYHYGFMIYFQNEMDQLILLQSKDQLEDEEFLKANTFINCAIHDKFIIYLNSFTFNLFTYFLSHHELILLASIINDKIIFQKINHDQQSNLDIDCNSLLQLQNYTPGHNESSSSSNPLFQKIALGVPGTGELLQILREKSLLFREIMIPDLRKDQIYKVWIDKLIRPKATLMKILQNTPSSSSSASGPSSSVVNNVNTNNLDEARKKLQRVTSSPGAISSIAPAPALNASPQKAGKLEDSAMDVANSSSSATNKEEPADNTWTSLEVNPRSYTSHSSKANPLEPSIIFGTISNCDEGLISLRLNPTVTQAVSGYRDSIVRVWRLDENANDAYDDSKSYQSAFGKILKGGMYDLNEVIPKPKEAFNSEYTYQQNRQLTQNHKRFSNGRSGGMDAGSRRRYPMIEFKGHSGPVYSVDQNCTDRVILSSSADESIRLWDTAILQCVGKYVCSSIAWDVQFNPILDYYFASANQDGSVSLYATDRTVPIRMMTGHISDVNCLSWHGNNTFLASGSDDRTVRLWDIRSAQCNRLLKGSNSPITSISICGVGNLLAAGNEMGKIYLYDLRTSRVLSVLHGHDSTVYSLAFNEDISTLVSGSHDCSVRIWDLYPVYDTTFVSNAAYQVNVPIVGNETTTPSNTPSTSVLGGVLGGISSIGSQSASLENYVTKVIKSRHSFFTKASPVYHVGFTSENLVYAGGPCSFETAASSREKYLFQTNQGSGGHTNTSSSNKTVITEQEAVNILGISEPTTSNG